MKLTNIELKGLRQMIETTSSKVLNKYKNDNENNKYQSDTVFIGDSMIEYFKLDSYLPQMVALNRGIAGATTKLILDNFVTIFGDTKPKTVYVSIGSNDLVLLESTIGEAYLGIVSVFEKIQLTYPGIKIHYLSTTPVVAKGHKLYKKIYIGGRTNGQLKSLNYKVEQYCLTNNIAYINQFDGLLDTNGYLNDELTADGIHLNKNGYKIYAKTILNNL